MRPKAEKLGIFVILSERSKEIIERFLPFFEKAFKEAIEDRDDDDARKEAARKGPPPANVD